MADSYVTNLGGYLIAIDIFIKWPEVGVLVGDEPRGIAIT